MDMYNREPGDMNDRDPGGFHTQCMSSDMHVWIKTKRSIEDSIHSKRRNRLGQEFVECLVQDGDPLGTSHQRGFIYCNK